MKGGVVRGLSKGLLSSAGGVVRQEAVSAEQAEILRLYTEEFLTIKKIAIRRQTTRQAVSKTIRKLREKGLINIAGGGGCQGVVKIDTTRQPPPLETGVQSIRLHGLDFIIKLIHYDQNYIKRQQKANLIYVDGNTVRLYRDSIEVNLASSFYGDTPTSATAKAYKYLNRLLNRMENDLKVILVKPRGQNIRQVAAHYSEIHNELSKDCGDKAEKIRVHTTDDAKVWFTIDNSFNLHEAETLHPQTSKRDMETAVIPFFNDIRNNAPPLLSEFQAEIRDIAKVIHAQAEQNKETAAGLNAVVTFIKSQLPKPEAKPEDRKETRNDGGAYFG